MKLQILIVILLISFQAAFSQTKEIRGDTAFWYKRNVEFRESLGLKSFEKSSNEFDFRFKNHGQVIEISKNGSKYSGALTNYIYHSKKSNSDDSEIISNTIILSPEKAESIYKIIQNSKILELSSDTNIENWKSGADGTTYVIEHSDTENYWFNNYWSSSSQGSILETQIVIEFVENLSNRLDLKESYNSFRKDLPQKGCYHSEGMVTFCYVSNSFEVGYSGSTKLPFGFSTSFITPSIGKTKINGSATFQYNFDNNGFHHLNFQAAKWNILYKEANLYDFLAYNYQNRIININDVKSKFENHQIKYGLHLQNNINIGIGFDYITRSQDEIGGHLYGYKWFPKPNISTTLSTSIFSNQVNYKGEIMKSFYVNDKFSIRRISIGIAYEDFMNYKDVYFQVQVLF